jgi:hypothetical protein
MRRFSADQFYKLRKLKNFQYFNDLIHSNNKDKREAKALSRSSVETVEEFLTRGGVIEELPPVPDNHTTSVWPQHGDADHRSLSDYCEEVFQ